MNNTIKLKDLVLIGGGHAHVHTLKMMGMKPMPDVQVTLITRDIETPYSGMLPGYISGYYSHEECHVDLGKLCGFAGVRLLHVEANKLDLDNKLIYCKDGRPPIRYDVLSIDIGITPKALPPKTSNNIGNMTPVKPIDGFGRRWNEILDRIKNASNDSKIKLIVVGGGGGGTELTFAIHHRIQAEMKKLNKDPSNVEISIIQRNSLLMPEHNSQVRKILIRLLNEKDIKILNNTEIIDSEYDSNLNKSYLISKDGKKIEYDEAIFCTQACAQVWIRESGLDVTDNGGFINVKTTLESVNSPNVFACGDVAHLVDNPRPKAGVFAVRAGPPLTNNLRARLLGEITLEPWIPQAEFLGIIGTGGGYAVASKGPLGIEGEFLWKLKDKIDRIWMQGYSVLPDMDDMEALKALRIEHGLEEPESFPNPINKLAKSMGQDTIDMLSKSKMRCGGCGSKVGAQVLSRALSRVREFAHRRPQIIAGIGVGEGDDCALVIPPAPPAYLVHSIDYFRSFISDPFLFGQIAANHSLSDVHAMNGDAVSGLALCVIPYGPEQRVEDTVVQMLAGMMSIMKREGCSLVGGHTSEGTEAALGLSVNGVVHPDKVLRKGPCRSNDVLIVTKGLGTGTIMAADMRGKAKGRWLSSAFESMKLSNSKSASILFDHGCNACTDITGFGFLGHLLEMLQLPSEEEVEEPNKFHININSTKKRKLLSVLLKLSSMPLLPGAIECVKAGILSSLQPQNIRCARAIGNVELGAGISTYPLLFDPQTAGGLLGSVPAHRADDCIKELIKAGYPCSSIVGNVIQRDNEDDPLIWLEN